MGERPLQPWREPGRKKETLCYTSCVASYAMRRGAFAVVVMVSSSGSGLAVCSMSRGAAAQESHIDGCRAATKATPADPAAALALGRALRRAGHLPQALAELRRGVAVTGGRMDALRDLDWEIARVQMDKRDFTQTLTACQTLGKLPGANAAEHACTAHAYLLWQRSTEALNEAATALSQDSRSFEATVAQGRAYEFAMDVAKSEGAYRAAMALRPDSAEPHVGLGRAYLHGGRRDDGVAELRRALALDADAPDALYELGAALAPSAESVALLEHATRERPTFTEAWLALGTQQLTAGRVPEAKRAGEAAERGDPSSVAAKVLLGKVALAEGRADDAVREGEEALKIVPNSATAKLLVADAHAKKGDIDLALEAYQAAWGLDHGDPSPLVRASEACHAAGRDTSAKAFGLKAAQEFPAWAPAWVALGDALAAQNEKQAAKDAYQKGLAADGPIDRAGVQRKLSALP
jgi:tetratricopeptide (TPR) repeat protein